MGRKSATATVGRVMVQLLEHRVIQQSELAKHAGVTTETLRRVGDELIESGFKLTRELDGRAMVWSVAEGWFPSGVVFAGEDAKRLLRLLLRLRKSSERDAMIERLTLASESDREVRAARESLSGPDEAKGVGDWLNKLSRVAAEQRTVRIYYASSKSGEARWRVCSVQRVAEGRTAYAIVWDHDKNELNNYRPERVQGMDELRATAYVRRPVAELDAHQKTGINGYRKGPEQELTVVVHGEVWGWVKDNLPVAPERTEPLSWGTRIVIKTRGAESIERWLVGLAEHVTIETESMREAVRARALRSLAQHGGSGAGAAKAAKCEPAS
ncbi:MAG: WYL domain-containing protein [Deltaproteobacteria bacterium]|nr:WYL domain-containing protein [Deltaproteobacteria bacterium]